MPFVMYSMSYKFMFDFSGMPRHFFTEIARAGYQMSIHNKIGGATQEIIKKFRIQEITGLSFSDAVLLLRDYISLEAKNRLEREKFVKTGRRALFLPHCSRKYMDSRCKAVFDEDIPSYVCAHCSEDCLIGRAVSFAETKGYDVYILPGGSCIPEILKTKHYGGVVGVACGEEMKLGRKILSDIDVAGQTVPLTKNGCANTAFDFETLSKII